MRICCYTSTALPQIGGQELVVDALGRSFTRLGHEVVVLAPRSRAGKRLAAPLPPYAVAWHPRYRSTRWFVSWYGRWLARLHRQYHFDLLHCHDVYPTGYVAARCAAVASLPLVITSHGGDLACDSLLARKPRLRSRYVLALKRADAAIAISQFTQQEFQAVCPRCRIQRIPNGVDVARFAAAVPRPAKLDARVRSGQYVLFLGRLVQRKGVDLLLHAFGLVAGGTDVELVIAGEGSQRAALEVQVVRAGLGNRARFVGRVEGDTKTWLLQHALCTVIPSRIWEAFGIVVLESYAAGRPVIGSRISGLAELIEPDRTGFLVTPDSVTELSAALRKAIGQRDLLDRLGDEARRVAQQYDWDRVAERHLALFAELIAQARGRRAA